MANTTDRSRRNSLIVAGVIIVALLVFVAQNSEEAHVNFLFIDATLSLWFVIVATAVLGFLAGWFVGISRRN